MADPDFNILVAEESDDFLILKDIIESTFGESVQTIDRVVSFKEALGSLSKQIYDICLINYKLSDLDGIRLLRTIRQKGDTIPVIFLTAQEDQNIAVQALKSGATDHINKAQLSKEVLTQSINNCLELIRENDERLKTHQFLERTIREKELILNSAGEGIIVFDNKAIITYANPVASRLLGYETEELVGQDAFETLKHSSNEGELYSRENCPGLLTLNRGVPQFGAEDQFYKKDGNSFNIEFTTNSMQENGKIIGVVTTFNDITERLRAQETIKNLAFHDSLTGLPNRTLFFDRLNIALAHAKRYQERLAVLFVDLDDFKPVNDNLGHTVGDLLLQDFAKRMTSSLRIGDTVARYGGDEFVVILPQVGNEKYAIDTAQKIRSSIEKPFDLGGHSLHITASIGLALFPKHGKEGGVLLNHADNALYKAKDKGKNIIEMFY